ncbi:MAG: YbaN family protein, partial [Oscillospiraceae bacterium]|nr:YbaN family protein [Oscillospiraceae bacterium]
MKKIVKPLFITLGFISLGLGTLGIFLPILPTTPLYLLTVFCFARGSTRFHNWFLSTGLYKKHLEGFVKTRSMTMKRKIIICAVITAMLSVGMYFSTPIYARIIIAAVMLFHWW